MATGRAEVQYVWGGDLGIGPTGDFIVLVDTPQNPAATTQRIIQLIETNALEAAYDYFGNPTTLRPDDLFNPNYGSSIRRLIGSNATQDLLNQIKSRLLAAFATDPGIATSPAPVVNISLQSGHIVLNQILVYDLTGTPIPIPVGSISAFGTQS